MVAPLLAPVVAKTFQGPWETEESKGFLLPEPQRLLARALGAASVQEVQVWPWPALRTSSLLKTTAKDPAVLPVPLTY